MTRNTELLERTMQHLVDHPELHDQMNPWVYPSLGNPERTECGTPACFVGWAFHLEGMTLQDLSEHGNDLIGWTQDAMGLTRTEVMKIFSGSNTLPMLELMIKDIVNGDELRGDSVYRQEAHGDLPTVWDNL